MNIHVKLNRKEPQIESDPCLVEKVVELTESEFRHFQKNLLNDYDFIRENVDLMYRDQDGIYHCLLVLGEGEDDGIVVEAEGSFYARYSALVPNARQLIQSAPELCPPPRELKTISPEQLDIISAKHLLWLYDEGGEQADFTNCDLSALDLRHRNLNSALFVGARLYGAALDDAQLCFADFTGADLRDCSLRGITADEIVFKNAAAQNCDFTGAMLMHGNFTGTDLSTAMITNAVFRCSCFDSARIPVELLMRGNPEHYSINEQEWDAASSPVQSM